MTRAGLLGKLGDLITQSTSDATPPETNVSTTSNTGPDFSVSEHERPIDAIADFFKVWQECRTSSYFLNSLANLLSSGLEPGPEAAKERKQLFDKARELVRTFDDADQRLLPGKPAEDAPEPVRSIHIDLEEMFKSCRNFIVAKIAMDSLQLEILGYLLQRDAWLVKSIADNDKGLDPILIHLQTDILMESALHHSPDEDKIITWQLDIADEEAKKSLIEAGIRLPETFKLRDYEYPITKARNTLRRSRQGVAAVLMAVQDRQERRALEALNLTVAQHTRTTKNLTWAVTVLTTILLAATVFQVLGWI